MHNKGRSQTIADLLEWVMGLTLHFIEVCATHCFPERHLCDFIFSDMRADCAGNFRNPEDCLF